MMLPNRGARAQVLMLAIALGCRGDETHTPAQPRAGSESEAPPAGPARYDVEWGTTSTLDRRLPTDRRQSDRRAEQHRG